MVDGTNLGSPTGRRFCCTCDAPGLNAITISSIACHYITGAGLPSRDAEWQVSNIATRLLPTGKGSTSRCFKICDKNGRQYAKEGIDGW